MNATNQRSEILWITPKWPFPVADGARIATTQILKNLSLREVNIHLCSIVPAEEKIDLSSAKKELGVTSATLVRRKQSNRFRQLLHFLKNPLFPVTLAPYATSEVSKEMIQMLNSKSYDLVVFDGLHAAAWKDALTLEELSRMKETAYRAHNVESDIWFRAATETSNLFKKLALYGQGKLVKKVETALTRSSQFIFPVSLTDENRFRDYGSIGKIQTLPIGMQVSQYKSEKSAENERKILFVGKLDWPPNREGLLWVLKNVWPKVREKASDISLTIVGSGDQSWLEPYRRLPGLNIVGQVDSLTPYYEECLATVVPIFYGSGTRVKAIESSLYGRPCISTQIGVEGMGLKAGEHYYQVETIEEWIDSLVTLKADDARAVGKKARAHSQLAFNPSSIADIFMRSVSRVVT